MGVETTIRLADFDAWFTETWGTSDVEVTVSGQFREKNGGASGDWLPLVRFRSPLAASVELLIPLEPPTGQGDGAALFNSGSSDEWWNAWAPLLASSLLLQPVCDPVRLQDILHETKRLRLCCDTSALASGVLAWLLAVLDGRADAVTSAVVDREVATWCDQAPEMWKAKDAGLWKTRTVFLLARRVLEGAPAGVVVDRISPDQNALVVAKGRADSGSSKAAGGKLPDADMLMIELARRLIREQPPTARMVYLTGDRNHARSAVGALGAENVFYAAADAEQAKDAVKAKIATRCWWRPDGDLGALVLPPMSSLFSSFLAGFRALRIQSPHGVFLVSMLPTIKNGAPSDWQDPWLKVEGIPTAGPVAGTPDAVPSADPLSLDLPPVRDDLEIPQEAAPLPAPGHKEQTAWLLPPHQVGDPVAVSPSVRLAPKAVFWLLWRAISGSDPSGDVSKESIREATAALSGLGALTPSGEPGPRFDLFRQIWMDGDLDRLHSEFLRVQGYATVIQQLRDDPSLKFTNRAQSQLTMARALGQVARLERDSQVARVGDRPVEEQALLTALAKWTGAAGGGISVASACNFALAELHLTPARFEAAMRLLWERQPTIPYEGETGGEVAPGYAERVVSLSDSGYEFRDVAPGALTFGRKGPIRFIVRKG